MSDQPEGSPEELKARIDEFKRGPKKDSSMRALGLVFSLGVTVIATLYGSYVIGSYLDRQNGSSMYLPIALLLGAAAGFWVGWLLLKPLLRDQP